MKKLAVVMLVAAVFASPACKKKVVAPPPPPPAPATPAPAPPPTTMPPVEKTQKEKWMEMAAGDLEKLGLLADVHYDYDKADLRDGDRAILSKNAALLKGDLDFVVITIGGHCDERGSAEYNLALGERRAKAAYDYLVSLGVPESRLKSVSFGKESPICQDSNESCWSRNRRAHLAVTGKTN